MRLVCSLDVPQPYGELWEGDYSVDKKMSWDKMEELGTYRWNSALHGACMRYVPGYFTLAISSASLWSHCF